MSDEIVIRVENLGKRYRIRHHAQRQSYTALREILVDRTKSVAQRLWSAFRTPRGLLVPAPCGAAVLSSTEDFWALRNVSFEVERGEVLGIIGRNGAGKSTLLKLLSRITEPTSGRVELSGSVASLLEVGTGFHPELTGRENIFLNGAILGMKRAELLGKFEEIVGFAEVERFIDTPVKRYSSGMYVRLAFAVAAHLEPDILIVDEVLAVGDISFQKRCLGKMEEVSQKRGRSVLFVSHNMDAISRLCGRALQIESGGVVAQGDARSVVRKFLSTAASLSHVNNGTDSSPFILHRACVSTQKDGATSQINWAESFEVRLEYTVRGKPDKSALWVAIRDTLNQVIICTVDVDANPELLERRCDGRFKTAVRFPGTFLNTGYYTVVIGAQKLDPVESYLRVQDLTFAVIHQPLDGTDEFIARGGTIKSYLSWDTQKLEEP